MNKIVEFPNTRGGIAGVVDSGPNPFADDTPITTPPRLEMPLAEALEGERSAILCPVCRDSYVHTGAATAYPYDRGSHLVVSFWCEQGHHFDLDLLTHKGETLASVRYLDHADDEEDNAS